MEDLERLIIEHDATVDSVRRQALERQIQSLGEKTPKSRTHHDAAHVRPQYAFNRYRASDIDPHRKASASASAFKLSPNQIFLKKWVSSDTSNDAVLLFHNVGVGKTCTSIQIAENFKGSSKALIITPKSLKANYLRELHTASKGDAQCVGDTYLRQVPSRGDLTPAELDKKMGRLIKRRYEILGFGEFANQVFKIKDQPELIRKTYSNRAIVVDEIHNLRTDAEEGEAEADAGAGADDAESEPDTDDEKNKGKKGSEALLLVLEHAHNVRLVLMSATPVYNDADEMLWVMSIIYAHAKDQQALQALQKVTLFSNASNASLRPEAHTMLAAFASRYVSYMNSNPFTFPARLYPTINQDDKVLEPADAPTIDGISGKPIPKAEQIKGIVLVASHMSAYQQEKYLEQAAPDKAAAGKKQPKTNLARPIQLANIAFPITRLHDSALGHKDLTAWFESTPTGFKYRKTVPHFLAPDQLPTYSPKMAAIIAYIKKSTGVVFVYSRYIWNGIVPMALALEHEGIKRIDQPLLEGAATPPGRGKYVVLSSLDRISPENMRQKYIDMVSARDNSDGSKVKVVFVTDVAAEGVDFKNIREIHILEPWYNMQKIEQIIGRGVRHNSHTYLMPHEQNCTIYHHVNLLGGAQKAIESVDYRYYRISDNKQRRVGAMECVLKQNAIDCNLNIDIQGIQPPASDIITSQGVAVPGFERSSAGAGAAAACEIKCAAKKDIQESSASVGLRPSMVAYEVDYHCKQIQALFTEHVALDKATIMDMLTQSGTAKGKVKLLDMALHTMTGDRRSFMGYGRRKGYLLRMGNDFVFQPMDIDDTKITIQERAAHRRPHSERVLLSAIPGVVQDTQVDVKAQKQDAMLGSEFEAMNGLIHGKPGDDIVWDMVVDRISPDAMMDVAAVAMPTGAVLPRTNAFMDALKRGGYMHVYKGMATLYLPHNNSIKIWKAAAWADLPDAFIPDFKTKLAAYVGTNVRDGANNPHLKGFIALDKSERANLKLLKKPDGQGSFCEQTATFTMEYMKQNIHAKSGPPPAELGAITKRASCYTYEYLLRKTSTRDAPSFYNKVVHAFVKPPKATASKAKK